MKTRLLIIVVILACTVSISTFFVSFIFLGKSNIEKLEKQIVLPDDFGELKQRRTCAISQENDVLTTMIGENETKIICPINCEVVKNTCVYPLPEDEIVKEIQKGPQELTYAESKFVTNIIKSHPKVQEIIGNRPYTYSCCVYEYEVTKNPHYFLSANLHMQDENEDIGILVDVVNRNVTVGVFPPWKGASGEEVSIKPELCQNVPPIFNSVISLNKEPQRRVFFVKTNSIAHLCIAYMSTTNTESIFSFPTTLYTNYYSANVAPTSDTSLTREPSYMHLGRNSSATVTYTITTGSHTGTYWLQDPYNDAFPIVVYSDLPKVDSSEIPLLIRISEPLSVVSTQIIGYDGGIMEFNYAKPLESLK